jgi:hypothetical protein
VGAPQSVLARPATAFVRDFLRRGGCARCREREADALAVDRDADRVVVSEA